MLAPGATESIELGQYIPRRTQRFQIQDQHTCEFHWLGISSIFSYKVVKLGYLYGRSWGVYVWHWGYNSELQMIHCISYIMLR